MASNHADVTLRRDSLLDYQECIQPKLPIPRPGLATKLSNQASRKLTAHLSFLPETTARVCLMSIVLSTYAYVQLSDCGNGMPCLSRPWSANSTFDMSLNFISSICLGNAMVHAILGNRRGVVMMHFILLGSIYLSTGRQDLASILASIQQCRSLGPVSINCR